MLVLLATIIVGITRSIVTYRYYYDLYDSRNYLHDVILIKTVNTMIIALP